MSTDPAYTMAESTLDAAGKVMRGNNASWEAQAALGTGYAVLALADEVEKLRLHLERASGSKYG